MIVKEYIKKNRLILFFLAIYFVFSFLTASSYLYNWDSGQLALGTERFSLEEHQPHPPGYILYVFFGKFLNIFFNNINTSFVFINVIVGFFTLFFLYKLTYLLVKNKLITLWVTVLLAINPVFWFYRSITSTYVFEALTASFLSYFTYLTVQYRRNYLALSVFFVAILAGFRPSVVIIALPFLVFQLIYVEKRPKIILRAAFFGFLGLFIWLPFFISLSGGLGVFSEMIVSQLIVAKNTNVYDINHHGFLYLTILYSLFLPILLIFTYLKRFWRFFLEKKLFFVFIAIIWQILVYFFLHFGEAGYILAILPLAYLLMASAVYFIENQRMLKLVIILAVFVSVWAFFNSPFLINNHKLEAISHKNIENHDFRLKKHIEYIKQYDPEEVLIVVLRGQYLNPDKQVSSYPYNDIRTLSYYLPEYELFDLLGVKDLYFTAKDYKYSKKTGSEVVISPEKRKVVFLADYIYRDMLPQGIDVKPLYEDVSVFNLYYGEFDSDEFGYNGVQFIKSNK